jgi:serine/threonine protein kinase/tetratricopeptide (TPR) repeat protein
LTRLPFLDILFSTKIRGNMAIKCPKCHTDNPDTQKFCGECATPLGLPGDMGVTETMETPKEELTTGSTFAGRYQIIEELGKGGMGRVYKVHDFEIKEKVALKLLKPEIASDAKTIERFRNEIRLARKIAHRNVCRMYDLGEERGTRFITMEYVDGEDLKSTIRRIGRLPVGKSIAIARQICEGLEEAHRLGVVHRDLKPGNIMLDKEGNARIMDFGIARSLKTKGITGAGIMIGTPEYMSPEQVDGKETDLRSDIYSLGVILYEMVTGQMLFEGDSPFTVGMKHKGEVPKDPKELNPQIPDDLSMLILRCLEKDKEKRYPDAGKLRLELENIEKGIPTTEKTVSPKKPLTSKEITVTFGLKKLALPAALIFLVAAFVVIWLTFFKEKPVSPPQGKPSIAVLPFEDWSPEKDQEALCKGLAVSLITALNKIEILHVPAPASSFSFEGEEKNIQAIGEKLKVSTILVGSIQKSENRIRIMAQLIDVADESTLWSDVYNRELEDIFDIQDNIALAIAESLKLELLGPEKELLKKRYTENVEAYSHYTQGLFYWNKRTAESLYRAIEEFQKAIDKDPDYALAYVGLADCYNLLSLYGYVRANETFPRAKEAALRAIELDDSLGEAHNSLAYAISRYDWDQPRAEREFKRAIALNPNYATAHFWYAENLMIQERFDEAIGEMNLALKLDPISLIINSSLSMLYLYKGEPEKALQKVKKTVELDPGFAHAHLLACGINAVLKHFPESIEEGKKSVELSGRSPFYLAWLGWAYAAAGMEGEARKILGELIEMSETRYVSTFWIAVIHTGLREKDRAFEYLDKAYEEHFEVLAFLNIVPFLDPIRDDPRFTDLLKKVGLE